MMNAPERGRFQGVLQILRFNWPMYATAVGLLTAGALTVLTIPLSNSIRFVALLAIASAVFWLIVSLAVSHYVYDRAGIYRGAWLSAERPRVPLRYANLHAGLDEFSPVLAALYPGSEAIILDFFDAQRMTEPSIARARKLATDQPLARPADFRSLPLADEELDTAFVIFAAHELREPDSRVQLFRELRRVLKSDGQVVLVEHLRDLANFLAFGPGSFHFHSRATWMRNTVAAGLEVRVEFPLTPFVRVFILEKT